MIDCISLKETLRELVVCQLKISQIVLCDDEVITNYGVSSLTAVAILKVINEQFCLDLDLDDLLENFTIKKMVNLILYKKKNS